MCSSKACTLVPLLTLMFIVLYFVVLVLRHKPCLFSCCNECLCPLFCLIFESLLDMWHNGFCLFSASVHFSPENANRFDITIISMTTSELWGDQNPIFMWLSLVTRLVEEYRKFSKLLLILVRRFHIVQVRNSVTYSLIYFFIYIFSISMHSLKTIPSFQALQIFKKSIFYLGTFRYT